jgi:hypothetical protein
MKNFMYTVLNVNIPVTYLGVNVHFHVKLVICHSVKKAI